MSSTEIKAIPTTYRGIELKSRLEAQTALLLDRIGWEWVYEPGSYMLPNGVSYTPDFLIMDHNLVIECRGYDSQKGHKQLEGFAELIKSGLDFIRSPQEHPDWKERVEAYIVLFGDKAPTVYNRHGHYTRLLMLLHCETCGWNLPYLSTETLHEMSYFESYCPACIYPMETSWLQTQDRKSRINKALIVTACEGKLLVNGVGVEEFNG